MTRSTGGQTSPLLLIALVLGGGLVVRTLRDEPSPPTAVDDPCALVECAAPTGSVPDASSLTSGAVCSGAGYLCARLSESNEFQVLRWAEGQPSLEVVIGLPDHEDPVRARELQRAAVRGIQAWQGKPFPLSIVDRRGAGTGRADIEVTWQSQLDGSALGTTHTRWEGRGENATFTSVRVVLATRSPFNRRFALTPAEVELVAAHEMGHALGLPHSDAPGDVMYPKNTAVRLSARDYRTMEALYGLANGVTVVRGQ